MIQAMTRNPESKGISLLIMSLRKTRLPILHIKAARGYVPEDIAKEVSKALQNQEDNQE